MLVINLNKNSFDTIISTHVTAYDMGLCKQKYYSLRGYTKQEIKKAIREKFTLYLDVHNSYFIDYFLVSKINKNFILKKSFNESIGAFILEIVGADQLIKFKVEV